jgi:acyl carrier protein
VPDASILDTVLRIVSEHADTSAIPDDDLVDELGMDSLELVDLAMSIETEFNLPEIDIDPETIRSARDIANLVESYASTNASIRARIKTQ